MFQSSLFSHAEPLRFAPLPMEKRETLVKQNKPMVLYLKSRLDTDIEFVFADNYADIIKGFVSGNIDLAYLGPLPYTELRAQDEHAEPLIHFKESSGTPMYTCALVSMLDQPLRLEHLAGRRFALTQPLSTCGYLSVNGLLGEHGSSLEDNRYRYLNKHDAVALAVVRGEFDAGGLKTAIARKYLHLGLQIIAETKPMPSFSLVANRATVSEDMIKAIRSILTSLDPTGHDRDMLASWGENIRYGAVAASDRDYDGVRALKGDTTIPEADKD